MKQNVRTWRSPVNKILAGIREGRYSVAFARRYASFLSSTVAEIDEQVGKSKPRLPNKDEERRKETQIVIDRIKQAHPEWSTREIGAACGMSSATVSRYTRGTHDSRD